MSENIVSLGEITRIRTGKLDANESSDDGAYPFFTCSRQPLRISSYSYDCECVLVAGNGDLNVKYYNGPFDAYQRTYIVEATDESKSKLHIRYLFHFLEKYLDKLRSQSIGGVIKYIKLGNLTDAKIPLPPLEEQKRIAAILDKADGIRRKRQQAFRLTDDFLRSTFLDMFGDPVTNPKGWDVVPLSEALEPIGSGWSPKCHSYPSEVDQWGILKLGSVTYGEYNSNQNKALPEELMPKPHLEVRKGDLLFTRKNTHNLVAASAYVFETPAKLMMPDLIFRLQPKEQSNIFKTFLWQQLSVPSLKGYIQSLAGGAAGSMPNISKAKLLDVEVMKPPVDLQQIFDEICHRWRSNKNAVSRHLESSRDLFASLQQRAFRGEL